MRLAVLGPPGSGRETIAGSIAAGLAVPCLSLADAVQAEMRAKTPAALQALQHMNAGELVPDQVLLSMIRNRLTEPDVAAGFVLDGLPNHVVTAVALDAVLFDLGTPIDRAIDLVLPDAEVLRRLAGRRTCRGCGRTWHTEFAAPARPNICDRCGGELFQRHDDNPDRITAGLQSYRPAAAATLSHYRASGKLTSIDATLTPAEITAKALADGAVAVDLCFPDDCLTPYNALNEDGLAFGQLQPQYRRHRLG